MSDNQDWKVTKACYIGMNDLRKSGAILPGRESVRLLFTFTPMARASTATVAVPFLSCASTIEFDGDSAPTGVRPELTGSAPGGFPALHGTRGEGR